MNAPTTFAQRMDAPQGTMKGAAPFSLPERMIAMRYLRAKKSEGGVALIAGISFTCIMLAIAAMIIIMSIMNGFREDMISLTIGSEGHMYVSGVSDTPTDADLTRLEQELLTIPDVTEAFRYTQNISGLQANGRITVAQANGISPADLQKFRLITDNVVAGSLEGFGQGRGGDNQVILGSRMAASLGVIPGDRVTLLPGRTRSTIAGTVPIMKPYTVGAVFEIGVYQTDLTFMFVSLDQANLLFNDGVLQPDVQVRLEDPDLIDGVIPKVRDSVSEAVFIQTWRDKNGPLATALRTEQIAMRLIFMIVVVIATFPVLAAMIMLVKNKSRDIAILRTIGATRQSILRIFFMTGAMIGILGTIVGLILGILFCVNIESIQGFIELFTGPLFPPEAYQLTDGIPVKIVWSEVATVAIWGMGISFLATLLPALTASRTDPVDALRYE